MTRTGDLRRVSNRRRRAGRARDAVIAAVLERDGETCRAASKVLSVACGGAADVHEIIPRSAWPDGYLVVDNCVLICRRHHEWVDANPAAAHALGLHGFSWERPDARLEDGEDEL